MTELSKDPKFVNSAVAEAMKEEPIKIQTIAPSNNEVVLPGGYISREGILAKYAEVRELTGADEEAISKAGTVGKALNTILQRGIVSIGAEPATKDMLDDLLAGDRDVLLLAIRKATFGEEVEYGAYCSGCSTESVVKIDLNTDIKIDELNNPIEDRQWAVEIKAGTAIVSLPTGELQRRLMENTDKTTAELNTLLLSSCLIGINGSGSLGASTVLKLGMGDREKLVDEIIKKNPGPRLGEVVKACEACGESMNTPLSLAGLFRL